MRRGTCLARPWWTLLLFLSLAQDSDGWPGRKRDWLQGIRTRFSHGSPKAAEENRKADSPSSSIPDMLLAEIDQNGQKNANDRQPWWRNIPLEKLGRPLASFAQIGIALYLAHSIWRAASEVFDEFLEEVHTVNHDGFSDERVAKVLNFLEQPPGEAKAQIERAKMESATNKNGSGAKSASLPHLPTLEMAQKLALAGLPLRSSNRSGGGEPKSTSVESVLLSLTKTEVDLLQQVLWVPPTDRARRITWHDIVGLEHVKNGLLASLNTVTGNLRSDAYDSLFENSSSPGVLLYGPPGCGKTLLIKALSAQSRLPCLVITPSVLVSKYVGESNQLCRALFSLAHKLSPCILCIDEVDGLFRARSDSEHEVVRELKTEFLQRLDGVMTTGQKKNLVVAATNRPFDVDSAILRRLTQSHFVDLPAIASRCLILRHLLRFVPKDPSIDILLLSHKTDGYSPSDLGQLLQSAAAMGPLQESSTDPPPLTTEHVLRAMEAVPATHLSAHYRWALSNFAQSQNAGPRTSRDDNMHNDTDGRGTVSKWETESGNFYHLGGISLDSEAFDQLTELGQSLLEDYDYDGSEYDFSDDNDL